MYHHQLSEQAIISGFRKGDANIIEDYLRSFDVTNDLRLQFNRMVENVCDHAPLDREERLLIDMLLLRGFKGKEIAAQMGMTPSAISQKYKKLKEEIIIPYFKKNFDMDLDMVEVMDEWAIVCREAAMGEASMPAPTMPGSLIDMYRQRSWFKATKKRITKGELSEERLKKFNILLEVAEKYRRLNQYK